MFERNIELDKRFMREALKEAEIAEKDGEVPIGAVIVRDGEIIAKAHNRCIELNDPTAHAEILVIREAGRILKNYRLDNTVIYVTAEPCAMCVSAMINGRISRLVFGALEPKTGAVESRLRLLDGNNFNHRIEVEKGVLEEECLEILRSFFRRRRMERRGEVAELV